MYFAKCYGLIISKDKTKQFSCIVRLYLIIKWKGVYSIPLMGWALPRIANCALDQIIKMYNTCNSNVHHLPLEQSTNNDTYECVFLPTHQFMSSCCFCYNLCTYLLKLFDRDCNVGSRLMGGRGIKVDICHWFTSSTAPRLINSRHRRGEFCIRIIKLETISLVSYFVCFISSVLPLSVWEHIRAALPVLPISPPGRDGPCDWWLLHRIREYLGYIQPPQTYVHVRYCPLLLLSTIWKKRCQEKCQNIWMSALTLVCRAVKVIWKYIFKSNLNVMKLYAVI